MSELHHHGLAAAGFANMVDQAVSVERASVGIADVYLVRPETGGPQLVVACADQLIQLDVNKLAA